MKKRVAFVSFLILIMFLLCMIKLCFIISSKEYMSVFSENGKYTVTAGHIDGMIYDKNMNPLVNRKKVYKAVVIPNPESISKIRKYVVDKEKFSENIKTGKPFVCKVTENNFESDDIYVFEIPLRYSDDDLAVHITGYTSDGSGVCGIEKTYDPVLRGNGKDVEITFSSDAQGGVLRGRDISVSDENVESGVVLTLDSDIQKICEEVCGNVKKGAAVVMDVKSGDILAMASFPLYKRSEISKALENEDSPLLNRALCAYSVGSVFKLVTCAAAHELGTDKNFMYECDGKITIDGSDFHCHNLDGHGKQDVSKALVNSCNPFFIELGKRIDSDYFLKTAMRFGFGREIVLSGDILSDSGTLPSLSDIEKSGEKANFSFGQGKLTATPLQVAQFTCAIANGGNMPAAKVIKGYTSDGKTIKNRKKDISAEVMSKETSLYLRSLMKDVVYKNDETKAKPFYTSAGVKTSTAQTGRFDLNGKELNNAWLTGFFPANNPEYAVTVLVEDADSGNKDAAPLFRKIADRIYKLKG